MATRKRYKHATTCSPPCVHYRRSWMQQTRLPRLNKARQSNLGDEPADTQIREISGEARGISFQWEIAPVGNRAEWAESSFVESVALVSVIGAGASHSVVALEGQLSPDRRGIVTR